MRNARDAAPAAEGETSSSVVESPTSTPATPSPPIKMEVGIEDCLHIEFEYDKAAYHLSDVVLGRISFLLVRIRLKHMELEVRRRETSGSGASAKSEATTLCKYEIMDGAPVRGETVPIRLCLAPYDLTPTYLNVHNKVKSFERERERERERAEKTCFSGFFFLGFFFSVFFFPVCARSLTSRPTKKTQNSKLKTQFSARYFLNLVLVDEEDRRYFKQQEITLWRKRGADERACRGGAGCGGSVPAPLEGGGSRGAVSPAVAAVSPATSAASLPAAATATTAQQQPTQQLQREEEEEAAPPAAAVAAEGEEKRQGETATTAATEEQPPPAMPPAA